MRVEGQQVIRGGGNESEEEREKIVFDIDVINIKKKFDTISFVASF